jgi:hypothetical protein
MSAVASWYHCSVKPVSRSAGRSVVAAAAYRLGERLHDEVYQTVHDYTRRRGVEATFTVAPKGAPEWAHDPESPWNGAERAEKRKNSTLAREVELALPSMLEASDRQRIAERFAGELVDRYGVAVSVAIHEPGRHGDDRNHHAHILFTTRDMTPEGLGKKTRILDDLKTGPQEVTKLRELAAGIINEHLAAANADIRVDHRSFKERGIEQEPTTHLGPAASQIERRGEPSERGDMNRAAQAINDNLAELKAVDAQIEAEQEKAAAPPETVEEARARVEEQSQPFEESIATRGAVPNIENDGLTWWQRTAMRIATKTRQIAQVIQNKAWSILTGRWRDRNRGMDGGFER